ncbi:hypothetical protein DL98DRAFT_515626 [Cadophora sp. DSE1049]|nr:hypothetical protein DL98DRAFT_515626 [Cadophora sp. DSE1049]
MGPLMTPTTELFYAFISVDDTPVPCDLPEVDVFSRAFKQATVAQPDFKKNEFKSFAEQDSPQDSPQDLIFDDFPSKDPNDSEDTSPSSDGSSSAKPFPNTSKYNTTSSDQPFAKTGFNSSLSVESLAANGAATTQITSQSPRLNTSTYRVEPVERPQSYGPTIPNNAPFFPHRNPHEPPKPPPRRRNTKRKMRTEEEEAEKRRIFLERNRMAAQKCRSRKKRQTNTLEDDLALQEEINTRLKAEVAELTAELGKLKEVYLQCEQECRHAKLQEGAPEPPEAIPSPVLKKETVEAMDVS